MTASQTHQALASSENFAGLIGQALSADNVTRQSAEDLYADLKRQHPDACATNLLQIMRSSGRADIRATCAVFLRKYFKPGPKESGWEDLNRGTKTVVKRELLAALAVEGDRTAALRAADAVVELGLVLLPQPGWPDLTSALQAWLGGLSQQRGQAGATAAVTTEAALQVLAGLALPLKAHAGQLAPLVTACIAPGREPAVQVAALNAVAAFLEVLSKAKDLKAWQGALAGGLAALQAAVAAGQSNTAEQLLVVLIRTAEVECGLWQPHMRAAVGGMLSLAGPASGAPPDVRKLAAEWVLTCTDIKPQMVQDEVGPAALASQLVGCLAHFLTDIEDDPAWGADPMASPDMEEDDTLGELHRHGLECLARAAEELDSGALLGAVVAMARGWGREAGEWRRRHAVLMCLSQVAALCREELGPAELSSLAGLLSEGLTDPHPRVRWAACHAVGVLAGDLGARLPLAPGPGGEAGGGGASVLRGLAAVLAEAEGPGCPQRVKAQACRGLVGFLEGMDKVEEEGAVNEALDTDGSIGAEAAHAARVRALLGPHLQPLCTPLLAAVDACAGGAGGVLRGGGGAVLPTPLQEFALDALTRLAVCLKDAFAPVFSAAMPRVLAVLQRVAAFHAESAVEGGGLSEEEATAIVRVQVGAVECAAFMCRAVGSAAATPHLPALAPALAALARRDLPPASQLLVPLLAAAEPLAECFGPGLGPLLQPLLPLLVAWAGRDVGLQVDESEDGSDADGSGQGGSDSEDAADTDSDDDGDRDDSDVEYRQYGGLTYRCSAAGLGAKAAAVDALEVLVDKMGPAIAGQATAVADALLPRLLEYQLDEVHATARRAVPKLVRHVMAAATHGSADAASQAAASPDAARALLRRCWAAVVGAVHPGAVAEEAGPLVDLGRQGPTLSTKADMVEVLASLVEGVEGSMLAEAWVAEAFAALQGALASAQEVADAEGEGGDGDAAMESDGGSEDLGRSSESEEEEEEADEEEGEEGESPAEAAARLKQQVAACVGAFSHKYGDAVAAAAQRVFAAAGREQQRAALLHVRNGAVA